MRKSTPYSDEDVESVLIVGHGYAGRRFAVAVDHLARTGLPLYLAGVCERDSARLPEGVSGFTSLHEALAQIRPTIVCVTVNEQRHAEVYDVLADYAPALVLSEKPLTADPSDSEQAARDLKHHGFSMNLVERFSPIVEEYRRWAAEHGPFELARVEAFWGKHRIGDPRATMGVLSELIHPLDLIGYLFPIERPEILQAMGIMSDFSPLSSSTLDTVHVLAMAEATPVLLHSSYAWPARKRTVTALLRSTRHNELYRAQFVFDSPHWDHDRLEISAIGADGWYRVVHESAADVQRLPQSIRGVSKVVAFVDSSVRAWRGQARDDERAGLVDLDGALRLQHLLADIDKAVACQTGQYMMSERG